MTVVPVFPVPKIKIFIECLLFLNSMFKSSELCLPWLLSRQDTAKFARMHPPV